MAYTYKILAAFVIVLLASLSTSSALVKEGLDAPEHFKGFTSSETTQVTREKRQEEAERPSENDDATKSKDKPSEFDGNVKEIEEGTKDPPSTPQVDKNLKLEELIVRRINNDTGEIAEVITSK